LYARAVTLRALLFFPKLRGRGLAVKTFAARIESVLISPKFWIIAAVILIALPFLALLIQWLDAQNDFIALCRGLIFGGR
jgi:hypothetical protein